LGATLGATDSYEAGDNKVEITLSAGDVIECTFDNMKRAEIIIDKVTNPAGASESFNFKVFKGYSKREDFGLSDETPAFSTFVEPGNGYRITEDSFPGWHMDVSCTGGASHEDLSL